MPKMKISFLGPGSGTSTNRAHTAMVYDCDDGTRLLIDTSSGNSVARNGSELGIPVESFDTVLLSHHHPDHMAGLLFVQFSAPWNGRTPRPWTSTAPRNRWSGRGRCASPAT